MYSACRPCVRPVRRALGNGRDSQTAARRRGISSDDHFDHDDLPEATFDRGLA